MCLAHRGSLEAPQPGPGPQAFCCSKKQTFPPPQVTEATPGWGGVSPRLFLGLCLVITVPPRTPAGPPHPQGTSRQLKSGGISAESRPREARTTIIPLITQAPLCS